MLDKVVYKEYIDNYQKFTLESLQYFSDMIKTYGGDYIRFEKDYGGCYYEGDEPDIYVVVYKRGK